MVLSGIIQPRQRCWRAIEQAETGVFDEAGQGLGEVTVQQTRQAGTHHVMHVTATKWVYHLWKDLAYFYVMLGAIPASLLILYHHVYVGPATLKETPQDYTPKEYEYYQYPIQRFLAKYWPSYQEKYEIQLHKLYQEDYKRRMRQSKKKVGQLMKSRADYKGAYYVPMSDKYINRMQADIKDAHKHNEYNGV
nr:EOG090X0FIE [Artemia franciscana]